VPGEGSDSVEFPDQRFDGIKRFHYGEVFPHSRIACPGKTGKRFFAETGCVRFNLLFHYGEYFRVEIVDPSRKIIRNIPGHVVYHDEKFCDGHALFFRKERILLPEPVKVLGKIDDSSRDTRGMAVDALECFLSGIGIPVGMID